MTDRLIEVQQTTKNGVFQLVAEGEQVGEFDLYDIETMDDPTLDALATQAAFASQDRHQGRMGI